VSGEYMQLNNGWFVARVQDKSKHGEWPSDCGEGGFTLLESMMAAVVLAVGLLALAGMQGISLGRNVDANELTLATNLAADMVERIQFNRRNAIIYNNIDTLTASTNPTSNIMASGDYIQWQTRLQQSRLSGVQGRVAVANMGPINPSLNQSQVVVLVNWQSRTPTSAAVRTRTVTLTGVIAPE
jgi:type IV pilus assembly protein PilV